MIRAAGHRVMVKIKEPESVTKGGIIIAQTTLDQERRASELGVVVDIGPTAWKDPSLGGEPWCAVGDTVFFAKFAGKWVKEPGKEDAKEFLILNDEDIVGVVTYE